MNFSRNKIYIILYVLYIIYVLIMMFYGLLGWTALRLICIHGLILFIFILMPTKEKFGSLFSLSSSSRRVNGVLAIFLAFLTCLIFAKTYSYFELYEKYERISWLHHYSGSYTIIPAALPLVASLCCYLYIHKSLKIICLFLVLVTIALDGTRMSLLYYAGICIIFSDWARSIGKIIHILISAFVALIGLSVYRLIYLNNDGRWLDIFFNFFHSFSGGLFLYQQYHSEVIAFHLPVYNRYILVKSVPGFDVFLSTIIDYFFKTNLSAGHFESVFWRIHEFQYVDKLGVDMNSYYTALIFFDVAGSVVAFSLISLVLFVARQGGGFFTRLAIFWLTFFLLSFNQFFINQNPGFSLIFLLLVIYGVWLLLCRFMAGIGGLRSLGRTN